MKSGVAVKIHILHLNIRTGPASVYTADISKRLKKTPVFKNISGSFAVSGAMSYELKILD